MNLIQIFSTPIWESKYPNFEEHKDLFIEKAYKIREEHQQNNSKNNILGYQSPFTVQKEPLFNPAFEFICQIARKAVFDMQFVDSDIYLSAAWININDNRSAILTEHVHQDTFSGVFYLQVPEKSGKLVINNSSINPLWQGAMLIENRNKFNSEKMKIEPSEGHVFFWPSYVTHSVEPNDHDFARISMSFNIVAIPKSKDIPYTK